MKKVIKILFLIALPLFLQAQEAAGGFVKYKFLKRNGGFLIGEIIEKKSDGPYHIRLDNGVVIEVKENDLLNVRPVRIDSRTGIQKIREIYHYKWGFNSEIMGVSNGVRNIGTPDKSVGVALSVNRYITTQWSAGAGIGLYNFDLDARRLVMPVFAQSKLRFFNRASTPVISIKIGHGIASKNYITGLQDKKGGLFLNPFFGYEFGATSKVSWTVGIGVILQKAYYSYENGTTFADEDILFRRTEFKLGFEFH